ncbi:MAG: hypothetical protein PVG54_11755 [Anaerolineae bacterium]|jgi:hypothetical protein
MNVRRILILVVVALLLPVAGGRAAQAGEPSPGPDIDPIWLYFDSLPAGTRIDDEYAATAGLHFLNDYEAGKTYRSSPQITQLANAHSSPNALVNSYSDSELFNSANVPLVFWSDVPLSGVGMWLGTTQSWCTPQASIKLYDCNGFLRGQDTAAVSSAFNTPIEVDITDPAHPAQLVVIDYGDTQCPEAIDDLAVQPVAGSCTDYLAPVVTITSHSAAEVVNDAQQILSGYVTETGILKSVKVNGAAAQVYYSQGFYHFSKHVTLQEGSNTLTVVAENGSGGKGSAQVVLTLGTPTSASLGQFHLTQRGVMKNASCDIDVPFVAGKSTLARIYLQTKTASGKDTYAGSVELKLWRQTASGDQLVDTLWGTTYSPFVSQFNSPNHMGAIHFWIPGDKVTTPGKYKFEFQPYVGLTKIGGPLVANCGGTYFSFFETDSVRPFLLPFEAGSTSQYLQNTDYVKYFAVQMDNLVRIYPVRDGYGPVWYTAPAGVYYAEASPLHLCDGTSATQSSLAYCQGTGYRWTFVDKSGTLTRGDAAPFTVDASYEEICPKADPTAPKDRNLGGIVQSSDLFTYTFTAGLGVFRPGAHPSWFAAKHINPLDADGDGDVDLSDLQRVGAEYRDGTTWSTTWSNYSQGDVFRFFRDQDGDNCNDAKVTAWSAAGVPTFTEPQADVRYLFEMWKKALMWTPLQTAYDAHNQAQPGTDKDAVRPVYTLPIPLVAPEPFHAVGGGSSSGGYSWIKVENSAVLAHELGHTYTLEDLYRQMIDPEADDLVTKENAWIVYVGYQSYDPHQVEAVMARGLADRDVFISDNYKTVFEALLKTSTAAAAPAETGPALAISGQIFGGDQLLEANTALVSDLAPTAPDPESPYRLVFGATDVLAEVPFPLEEPHGPVDDPTADPPPQEEDASGTPQFFHVVAPWPDGAEWVDLYVGEERLARFEPSAQAPWVALTRPNSGGSFGPYDEVPVTWEAGDPDGDDLQFTLYYSPDGGERWILVASGLTSYEYAWNLGDVPGTTSGQGLIRVTASDGFHSAEDLSDEPIAIGGKPPQVAILDPAPDQQFMQCERVHLRGMALDPEGQMANVTWFLDGEPLAAGLEVELDPLPPGQHGVVLEAVDNDEYVIADEVPFGVTPDADCDGMPDEFELAYGLELGLADDAGLDGDGDGLINLDEAWYGTEPDNPDTDGDGIPDGEEVALGTDPRDPDSGPQTPHIYLPLVLRAR